MWCVLQIGYACFGVGSNENLAKKDALKWLDEPEAKKEVKELTRTYKITKYNHSGELILIPCTIKFAKKVKSQGGDIDYRELEDGTICLPEEEN